MGPTFNFNKKRDKNKNKNKRWRQTDGCRVRECEGNIFLFFFLFSYFLDLWKSDRWISSSQARKVLYATRVTRGYQKHGISPRIQVKIQKILIFGFSQIYGVLTVRIFRTKS